MQITKITPGTLVLLYLVDPSWFFWCRHSSRAPSVIWNLRRSFEFTVHAPSVSHRNQPQFTNQPAQVTNVPIRPRTLVWRVLHLLRERGGHRHLRLWAHVSVLHLWPQTQENVQRLLSYLQKTDQRHYQDVPQHVKVDHLATTGQGSETRALILLPLDKYWLGLSSDLFQSWRVLAIDADATAELFKPEEHSFCLKGPQKTSRETDEFYGCLELRWKFWIVALNASLWGQKC